MRCSTVLVGAAIAVVAAAVVARVVASPRVEESPGVLVPQPSTQPTAIAAKPPDPQVTALAAVASTGDVATAGFIARRDLIDELATVRFAPELAAASSSQLAEMTSAIGLVGVSAQAVLWRELPLTSRLVAATDSMATVEVWSVLIVAVPGHGAPRQVWRTVSMSLLWERDAWRIDSWTTISGPTPALTPEAPISDITQLEAVLNWPSAGGER